MKEITAGIYSSLIRKKNHIDLIDIEDRDRNENKKGYLIKIRKKYFEFTDNEWQLFFNQLDNFLESISEKKK